MKVWIKRPTGLTLYALVWQFGSTVTIWDTTGTPAMEAPGTWDDARVGNCDIAGTETAGTGWYAFTIPSALPAGSYFLTFYEQAGASPAITDTDSDPGYDLYWGGATESVDGPGQAMTVNPSHQDKTTGDLVIWNATTLSGLTFDLVGGTIARKLAGSNGDFTGITVTNPKTQIFLEAGASGGVLAGPYEVEAIDAANAAFVGLVAHADLTADDTGIAASLSVAYRKTRNNRSDARVYGGLRAES